MKVNIVSAIPERKGMLREMSEKTKQIVELLKRATVGQIFEFKCESKEEVNKIGGGVSTAVKHVNNFKFERATRGLGVYVKRVE